MVACSHGHRRPCGSRRGVEGPVGRGPSSTMTATACPAAGRLDARRRPSRGAAAATARQRDTAAGRPLHTVARPRVPERGNPAPVLEAPRHPPRPGTRHGRMRAETLCEQLLKAAACRPRFSPALQHKPGWRPARHKARRSSKTGASHGEPPPFSTKEPPPSRLRRPLPLFPCWWARASHASVPPWWRLL